MIKVTDNYQSSLMVLMLLILLSSCQEFVEVSNPKNQIIKDDVFASDASAISAISGIYSKMMSDGDGFASGGSRSLDLLTGMSSDEFINYSVTYDGFYSNELLSTDRLLTNYLWNEPYHYIYTANALLEGLQDGDNISKATVAQLMGEAYFMRAFCYFYLVNLFGDLPLHTVTDYRINAVAERSPVKDVYSLIVQDLKEAERLLSNDYPSAERVRPNKWVAKALMARVFLYMGEWKSAEEKATELIEGSGLYSLTPELSHVFLKNSPETIWQLLPVKNGYNTNQGNIFILTTKPRTVSLRKDLYDAFEMNDLRKMWWTDSLNVDGNTYYFPYKYKIGSGELLTEYFIVFRLAEQYLIRSEARANLENITGSQADLNIIRSRAGLEDIVAHDKGTLLQAIEQERRIELFAEWGHRWFDLKRWKSGISPTQTRADVVIGTLKGGSWQATDVLYPIPQTEIERNNNLSQNQGY